VVTIHGPKTVLLGKSILVPVTMRPVAVILLVTAVPITRPPFAWAVVVVLPVVVVIVIRRSAEAVKDVPRTRGLSVLIHGVVLIIVSLSFARGMTPVLGMVLSGGVPAATRLRTGWLHAVFLAHRRHDGAPQCCRPLRGNYRCSCSALSLVLRQL
jgi:hypothetical protein